MAPYAQRASVLLWPLGRPRCCRIKCRPRGSRPGGRGSAPRSAPSPGFPGSTPPSTRRAVVRHGRRAFVHRSPQPWHLHSHVWSWRRRTLVGHAMMGVIGMCRGGDRCSRGGGHRGEQGKEQSAGHRKTPRKSCGKQQRNNKNTPSCDGRRSSDHLRMKTGGPSSPRVGGCCTAERQSKIVVSMKCRRPLAVGRRPTPASVLEPQPI